MDKSLYFQFSIKIATTADICNTIAQIKNSWNDCCLTPHSVIALLMNSLIFSAKVEQQIGQIFALFTALALFIASLGLLSLSSFIAANEREEIGIRKVLDATITNILLTFYKSCGKLIVITGLIAIPISYLFLRNWLQQFAFKIPICFWVFVLAIVATLSVAFIAGID